MALGVQVRQLLIEEDSGLVTYGDAPRTTADSMTLTAAGAAAECRLLGRICPADLAIFAKWTSDARALRALAALFDSNEDQARAYRTALVNAETMVADLWLQIRRVAEAAEHSRRMNEAAIRLVAEIPLYDRRRLTPDPNQERAEALAIAELELRVRRAALRRRYAAREQRARFPTQFLPWDVRSRRYAEEYV